MILQQRSELSLCCIRFTVFELTFAEPDYVLYCTDGKCYHTENHVTLEELALYEFCSFSLVHFVVSKFWIIYIPDDTQTMRPFSKSLRPLPSCILRQKLKSEVTLQWWLEASYDTESKFCLEPKWPRNYGTELVQKSKVNCARNSFDLYSDDNSY